MGRVSWIFSRESALEGTAAVLLLLSSSDVTKLEESANTAFVPHTVKHLKDSEGVDAVWDMYIAKRIKGSTRKK